MAFATAGFAADQAMQRTSGDYNVYCWVQRSNHCISEGTASSSPLRQVDGTPLSAVSRYQLDVELLQQSGVSKCGDGGVSILGDGGNHATCDCDTTIVQTMLTRQLLYRSC